MPAFYDYYFFKDMGFSFLLVICHLHFQKDFRTFDVNRMIYFFKLTVLHN